VESFEKLLQKSVGLHGHLCPGQVIGVRMAMLGLDLLGLDPQGPGYFKRIITFVEMDRCAADAIAAVTECKLGRRSLKYKDYGIMAATFLDLKTNLAYRVVALESSKDLVAEYAPATQDSYAREIRAYSRMPLEEMFRVEKVQVTLSEFELPGPTLKKTVCTRCGQVIRDDKEANNGGETLCRPCSGERYFEVIDRKYDFMKADL